MPVPKYDEMYRSLLRALADKNIHTNREIADFIMKDMEISPEERQLQLSNGKQILQDRVNWACTYLKKAALVERVRFGHYRLTAEGERILSDSSAVLDNRFLCQYPSFREFYLPDHHIDVDNNEIETAPPAESDKTPNDLIEQAFSALNDKLADDLMTEIMGREPEFFEALVVKLLLKMGYGGSVSDSGFVTQRSNDGGIDGIIREDKLGFDQIYIQAKRWDPNTSIGRPDIQKFSGALRDEGASKGLFITTARFSDSAKASAQRQHIVLVDGSRLTKLMIEYDLGVSTVSRYEIKTIDSDFFNEDAD